MKILQDNLGEFNDFVVQQEYLFHLAREWPHEDPASDRVLLAIGSLIGTLEAEKPRARAAFERTFTDFASPANRRRFKALFKE